MFKGILLAKLEKSVSVLNFDLFSSFIATRRVCCDGPGGRAAASQPHLHQ